MQQLLARSRLAVARISQPRSNHQKPGRGLAERLRDPSCCRSSDQASGCLTTRLQGGAIRRRVCAFLATRAEHPNTQAWGRRKDVKVFGCSDDCARCGTAKVDRIPLTHESRGNGGSLRPPVWLRLRASSRRSVTRNRNRSPVMSRLRLGMLVPVSARCSWKRTVLRRSPRSPRGRRAPPRGSRPGPRSRARERRPGRILCAGPSGFPAVPPVSLADSRSPPKGYRRIQAIRSEWKADAGRSYTGRCHKRSTFNAILPWCVRVRFRTAPCHPCRFLQRISRSAPTSPLLAIRKVSDGPSPRESSVKLDPTTNGRQVQAIHTVLR